MGAGQAGRETASPGNLEAFAVVAFVDVSWCAAGREGAEVAGVFHIDVAVGEVVEGHVVGRGAVSAGQVSDNGAVGEHGIRVLALDETQSADVNVLDGVEAVAAFLKDGGPVGGRRALHGSAFLRSLLAVVAFCYCTMRVALIDEDQIEAVLDVADVSRAVWRAFVIADAFG